ncbi:hypothetical protein PAECIP111893_01653 [Paenibacillus plantiphilus]|uniref:PA14 domain-containing protein n=1 Tax=Paenibacillus plantiphilus TaxID=2905650 RepID=A0ABN8GAV6_9BACL|nr:PA14 domain-containing protein [Paenibacillus plantiphilus]CAH1201555.1 hypothetical protein PAECIP111893_01653 [Paenibacillus plantiphilus]
MLSKLMKWTVVASMLSLSIAAAGPASAIAKEPQKFVDEQLLKNPSEEKRIIVQYKPEVAAERKASKKKYKNHKKFKHINAEAMTVTQKELEELIADKSILSIEEDGIIQADAQVADWGIGSIQANKSRANGVTGDNIKVAVFDTGIADHDDLNIQGKINYTVSSTDGDLHGHGTHVAGIIAALDNTVGVVGAAPDVDLYSVKVLGDDGLGLYSFVIDGIDWAIDNDIDIINMSLSGTTDAPTLEEACDTAYENGILLFAAAGNNSTNSSGDDPTRYPGGYESVIAVANGNKSDERSTDSNKGSHLELTAPGTAVYSTAIGNSYTLKSGTSMASPYAAAIAALYMEQNPMYTNVQIRNKLIETAYDLGVPGRDSSYGYGMVQAPFSQPLGTGLYAEYYNNADLTDLVMTRVDGKIDFDWGWDSPAAGVDPDTFSVRWSGEVLPLYSETYDFTALGNDGVRLWVDGQLIIDDWNDNPYSNVNTGSISLTGGQKYDIVMEFYDDTDYAITRLYWSSPSQSYGLVAKRQFYPAVPASSLAAPTGLTATAGVGSVSLSWTASVGATAYNVKRSTTSGGPYVTIASNVTGTSRYDIVPNNMTYYYVVSAVDGPEESANSTQASATVEANGLRGAYFNNMDFTSPMAERTDANINFNWGTGSPASGVDPDTFSVRWKGLIKPQYTETYTFYTNTDDGVRLYVNNVLVIDNWTDHALTENSGTITLTAGQKYNIKLEYYDNVFDAVVQLSWSSSSQSKQIVPSNRLYLP